MRFGVNTHEDNFNRIQDFTLLLTRGSVRNGTTKVLIPCRYEIITLLEVS